MRKAKAIVLATSLILIISTVSFYAGTVFGVSSPTVIRTGTGGAIGPCTWYIFLDGTTPVAEAMASGLSVNPGDNVVGTAGEGIGTFLNAIIAVGQAYCFSAQTFTVDQIIHTTTDDTFKGAVYGERSAFGNPLTVFNVASNIYSAGDPFAVFDVSNVKNNVFTNFAIWGGCSGFGAQKCRGIAVKVGAAAPGLQVDHVSFYDLSLGIYDGNGPGWFTFNNFDTIIDYPATGEGIAMDMDGGGLYVVIGNMVTNTHIGFYLNAFQSNVNDNRIAITNAAGSYCGQVVINAKANDTVTLNTCIVGGASDPSPTIVFVNFGGGPTTYIRNNGGFNPVGKITSFVSGSGNCFAPGGAGSTVSASIDYTMCGVDETVTSTGGTGVGITVKDPQGNTIQSGLATITQMSLPVGFKLNFGAFSGAPTVTVWGN